MTSRTLSATYRLQFRNGVGFDDARALVPYLAELGISHFYASPVFEASPGSTHGYDVVDYNRFEPDVMTICVLLLVVIVTVVQVVGDLIARRLDHR